MIFDWAFKIWFGDEIFYFSQLSLNLQKFF